MAKTFLRPMTSDEAESIIDTALNVDLDAARERILGEVSVYERKYNLLTSQMRDRVVSGELPETEEICAWLMADNARRKLGRQLTA